MLTAVSRRFAVKILSYIGLLLAGYLVGLYSSYGWSAKRLLYRMDDVAFGGRLNEAVFGEAVTSLSPLPAPASYEWLGSERFLPIAHGLGPQLTAGINQLETFKEGLNRGFRIFEVDLVVTLDRHLICFHGGSETQLRMMTYSAYVSRIQSEGGTPCEFRDLIAIVDRDPDIRFVLDVKNEFDEAYEIIRAELKTPGKGQAFIPQIYAFSQLGQFRKDHLFAGEIFTSYRSHLRTETIVQAARKLNIRVITLTRDQASRLTSVPRDLVVFVHTVDNAFEASELRRQGIRGIYTSYVTPKSVPEVFAERVRLVPLE